jgi:hypothetical protein
MKGKKLSKYVSIALILLSLCVAGPVQGQGAGPTPEAPGDPAAPGYILAQPPSTMNYQGYLTDSSGNPLNGTYTLAFRLYDAAVGGNLEWGPEAHVNVPVTNGLFQVALGSSVTLYPDDFDEALYLAVAVDGTWLDDRQPLRAVPYAFGLVPGAEVEGDPASLYGLTVNNTGTGTNDGGIFAMGNRYGLYAVSNGDVGIYSPNAVHAKSYQSEDDSYWWFPPHGMVETDSGAGDIEFDYYPNNIYGGVQIECTAVGYRYILLPLDVPSVLFGQDVRVEEIQIYYRTDGNAYINGTKVYKADDAQIVTEETIASDIIARTSTSATSYLVPISPAEGHTLDATSGFLLVRFDIYCSAVGGDVVIAGVRLRLGHTD